jgi:LPXTG-motif cell wall-anchored protein
MGGMPEHLAQTAPDLCGMPDTLTVHAGDTFWSTVRDALRAHGITDHAQLNIEYSKIVESNRSNIPDPSHIASGTVIQISHEGCPGMAQTVATQVLDSTSNGQGYANVLNLSGGASTTTPTPIYGEGQSSESTGSGALGLTVMGIMTLLVGGFGYFRLSRRRRNS